MGELVLAATPESDMGRRHVTVTVESESRAAHLPTWAYFVRIVTEEHVDSSYGVFRVASVRLSGP
jgi:hypothetical protein